MSHEGTRQARDRGATRSKAEKARPPTVPVPQVEIVPGRLNEAEWIALTALEEGEDVVGDILADLLTRVLDSAFKVYLNQQCVPFIISQAKEAMLQITEWRFLVRDEGESALADSPTWSEDQETLECTIDAWAQGSVPVLQAPASGVEGQDPGNPDRMSLGRPCVDSVSQEPRDSSEHSAELAVSPGLQATPGPRLEAGPEDTLEESIGPETYGLFSPDSLNESVSVEVGPANLVPELFHGATPRSSVEKGPPLSPYSVLVDLHCDLPPPDAAGDRLHSVPLMTPAASASWSSAEGPRKPSPPVSFQSPALVGSGASQHRMGYQAALARLDPAKLPCPWVRPLAEILVTDPQAHPLDVYHGRRRGKRIQIQAKSQPPEAPVDPKLHEPPAVHFPYHTTAPVSPLGPDPRFQCPNLNLDLPTPSFGSKLPFPSSGLRFPMKHPALSDVTLSTSPKLWPGAKWPSGWEGEAQLLGELWAERTQVAPRILRSLEKEDQDSGEPETAPHVLEATSQVLWKPMVLSEAIKLAPGVRMWNRSTRGLPSSAVPLEGDTSPSADRCPIQTGLPKQQMPETPPMKSTAPKVWLLPSKNEPSPQS
ncbi:uncharacterized protein C2orf81 homolog [Perognathus longimembris pacificus]|uniref:uncharacterized protein C2orf81 homolog n=1 Tax=Perognathus longimembris pacificus TaxID=214514 RepID=UPI002019B61F|nr:uncharacterized protein C2orf81 homolog [Perognathus longimembris pacificus]